MEYHDRYGKRHSRDKDASYDEKANTVKFSEEDFIIVVAED